jgi:hypothetical protein
MAADWAEESVVLIVRLSSSDDPGVSAVSSIVFISFSQNQTF